MSGGGGGGGVAGYLFEDQLMAEEEADEAIDEANIPLLQPSIDRAPLPATAAATPASALPPPLPVSSEEILPVTEVDAEEITETSN